MTDQILKNDVLGWDIINAVPVDEAQHNTFLKILRWPGQWYFYVSMW